MVGHELHTYVNIIVTVCMIILYMQCMAAIYNYASINCYSYAVNATLSLRSELLSEGLRINIRFQSFLKSTLPAWPDPLKFVSHLTVNFTMQSIGLIQKD